LAAGARLSGFVEVPYRFLNPEINANANGLADINASFKVALVDSRDLAATFQFRTYIPTGDAARGLGTNHVSLKPALLAYRRLGERLGLEGELRYLIPIGGTDFAGDLFRYGVGLSYDLPPARPLHLAPVAELVGWTVLSGKESVVSPAGVATVDSAAGDTIVNLKLGMRVKGCGWDLYAGYGWPLTGDRWYDDIVRLEFRLWF
jgi:hypothetical protein